MFSSVLRSLTLPTKKRNKLAPKVKKLTFVVYLDCHKMFRLIDKATKKVVITRDVCFVEMEVKTPSVTMLVYESVLAQPLEDEFDDGDALVQV